MKPTLLFLHGFPFDGSSWAPQMAHFRERFQVLAPDQRGHGNGPTGDTPWMIAHYAQDVKVLLDQNNIEKVILCGLSMGGYTALHFAQQHPSRVRALILSDTRADADGNEAKDKRFAAMQKIQQEGLPAFSKDFVKNALGETTQAKNPGLVKQVEAMILGNHPENVKMVLGALASRRDSTAFLSTLKMPTLVIVGTEDKVTPLEINKKLADGIAGAKFVTIKDAGHLANLEQPEAFNQEIEKFFAENKIV